MEKDNGKKIEVFKFYAVKTGPGGATWTSECRVCPTTEILIAVSSNQSVDEGHVMDKKVFEWSTNGYKDTSTSTPTIYPEIVLPNGVSYRVARKNGSTQGTIVDNRGSYITQNTTEDDLTQSTVNLISSGGQTTSCDCPVGYTEYVYRYQYTESTQSGNVWKENENPRWRAGNIKKFCIFVPESKSTD